jgi:hypothetical protein
MKLYTDKIQTAKLIELGFEKPINTVVKEEPIYREGSIIDWKPIAEEGSYSIGELIEMLPEFSCIYDLTNMHTMKRCWYVGHVSTLNVSADELIDALYDMVVKLKEERVI